MKDRDGTPEPQPQLKGFDDFELTLGDIMRGERATMGKSLLDVQRELKIKATYIAAIENTDPSAFETPGFVAGYVRSYARYLNLDPEWAYQTFCKEGEFAQPSSLSSETKPARGTRSDGPARGSDPFKNPSVSYIPRGEAVLSGVEPRAIGSVAVLLVLLTGLGYGGWSVLQEVQKVRFAPVEEAPGVISSLDPLEPALNTEQLAEVDVPQPDARAEALDRLYRPQALDVPVLVPRDASIATLDPSRMGALAPAAPEPPQSVAQASMAPPPLDPAATETVQVVEEITREVVLFAVRPAWVRVRAADGTVVFEKILEPGEEFTVPLTEEPPTLRAGNAGSVYFSVNGETYGPAGSGASVVKNVVLTPEAVPVDYAVADLTQDADLARYVAVAEAETAADEAE